MQLHLLTDGWIWVIGAGLGWIHFTCWKATGNNFLSECYASSFDIRHNHATFPSKHHTANETGVPWRLNTTRAYAALQFWMVHIFMYFYRGCKQQAVWVRSVNMGKTHHQDCWGSKGGETPEASLALGTFTDAFWLRTERVYSVPPSPANLPPREGVKAGCFSMCVVTFLMRWSRRSISEVWKKKRGQARLSQCQGEERAARSVGVNAGEVKSTKPVWRGFGH